VPAEYLPGIVSQEIRLDNFGSDTWISMHPAVDARDWLYDPQAPPIQIADVDDAYCSEQLIPDLKLNGMDGVARSWLEGQHAHVEFVSKCDAVFCSTPHLADLYSLYNEHVYVLRNAVLESDWRRVRKTGEDGKVRIGWAAGKQHAPDAPLVAEALRRVKKRHPEVEVCLVASFDPNSWDFEYVKLPNTPSLATYRQTLASFDISLGPIRNHEMGRAKSDLKWLEASMVGAAFIGSDCKPYATVKHGRTGLLCDTPDEWETAIESLVVDVDYRLKLAKAARKHVLTNRTSQKVSYQYRKALAEIRQRAGVKVAA
jgi:glycosyltransferase involved in cell wall biosynthesis